MVGPYLFIFRVILRLFLLLSLSNFHGSHRLRLQNRDFGSRFVSMLIISCLNTPVIVKEMRDVLINSLCLASVKFMTFDTTMSVLGLTCDLINLVRRQRNFAVCFLNSVF